MFKLKARDPILYDTTVILKIKDVLVTARNLFVMGLF